MSGILSMATVAIVLLLPQWAWASVVTEIQGLLQRGAAPQAYELALQHAPQQSGEIDFDFWFALAALESDHPEQAVFALERVLLQQPEHHRARLELGRAYYQIGDFSAAREAFAAVLLIQPPTNVRHRVEAYLSSIEYAEGASTGRVSGFIAASLGTDSNINSATADSILDIPALGQLQLSDSSLETRDEFAELAAAMQWSRPITKFTSGFVSALLKQRNHFSDDEYELGMASLQAGVQVAHDRDQVRLPVHLQKLTLGNESYRNLISVGMEWTHQQGANQQWSLFSQVGAFRYSRENSLDSNLKFLGAAWLQRWPGLHMQLASSVYGGEERAVDAANEHNGKTYYGARLGPEWQHSARHRPYMSLVYQASEYAARHPVFAALREDDLLELRLGWRWQAQPQVSLRAEFSRVENDSNLSLYAYDRDQFFLEGRYDF